MDTYRFYSSLEVVLLVNKVTFIDFIEFTVKCVLKVNEVLP